MSFRKRNVLLLLLLLLKNVVALNRIRIVGNLNLIREFGFRFGFGFGFETRETKCVFSK